MNPQRHSSRINNTAHFIWFGEELPLIYVLGIKSALMNGGFERVILHVQNDLSDEPHLRTHILTHPDFEVRLINQDHFAGVDAVLYEMYLQLGDRRAKSNVLRLVILARWGGIYLDTDVLILRDCTALREATFFFGNESNRYPHFTEHRNRKFLTSVSWILGLIRLLLLRVPRGILLYRWFEKKFYYQLPNNCVIGALPDHPLLRELFENMLALDPDRRTQKWQLGVRLFQRTIARTSKKIYSSLTVHPFPVFNPLGPVISALWFRPGSAKYMNRLLYPETTLVHWYSTSVKRHSQVPIHSITSEAIDRNTEKRALYCILKNIQDHQF